MYHLIVGGCAVAHFLVFGFRVFGFWFLVFARGLAHCLVCSAVRSYGSCVGTAYRCGHITSAGATTASSAESINRALPALKVINIHLEHKDPKERGKDLLQKGDSLSGCQDSHQSSFPHLYTILAHSPPMAFLLHHVWELHVAQIDS